jgi:hypothetical protein
MLKSTPTLPELFDHYMKLAAAKGSATASRSSPRIATTEFKRGRISKRQRLH